ncbi:hybrid sensor histidine kinase/response regulator [Salipiger sp. IMCC34102]|uniref:HWE histidine kinase domain-containing protein n=1 Tax=Salipiger sp. IMCC34102 TaxID=2510647 RepID=UPI00101DC64B|nr:HWE histidine kinase domain-containing protein [Salipiger sp. IMCC34102]RYH00986.1 hybrid sensor histidine kinase/response regulator [Salipiger sp. IMCC34102]
MDQADRNASNGQTVDLTNCDREPIHLLGRVQSYGCLVSTSTDLLVNHMSLNCLEILGLDPAEVVGERLIGLLPEKTVHDLRSKVQVSASGGGVARLFGYDVLKDGRLFDVSIHVSGGSSYVFEFEPKPATEPRDDLALVQPLMARIKRRATIEEAAKEAAMSMQVLSGFDRIMVYRFSPDGSGEVIAERCAPDMASYFGLRYPASDIPKQARALYTRNLLRLISDVDDETSELVPQTNTKGVPLDLSLAVTRAVSPIHLEYLRNIGVKASMSVSILKGDSLWGLIACHHSEPHYVDYERRTAIELFAQFLSYELERKIDLEVRDGERRSRELHDRLMVRLSSGGKLYENFDVVAEELSQIIPSDGIAIYSEGRYLSQGAAPTADEFRALSRFLNTSPGSEIFHTSSIQSAFPKADVLADRIAGVLAVPISRAPRDYIVFFRREIAHSIRWAGNPEKSVELGPNGVRLTPRKSFEAYTEEVRNTSTPWLPAEVRAAEVLRVSLIEIVLKLTDEADLERRTAAEKQELLIAELNHRVRNILNLIQGLVSQGKSAATDFASYTRVLDGRIQSLARAHDQLTRQEWGPTSLRELVSVEANAFLGGEKDRLIQTGDRPMLAAEAFSTMALVIHELVTNSAKYGALTDSSGTVNLNYDIRPDGDLQITWRERGGPPVKAPTRRGFGSTIIDRTVPFELGGAVRTRYKLAGFEADITIPADYISHPLDDAPDESETTGPSRNDMAKLSGVGLVVEDNLIIAMDATDFMMLHGATRVHQASSVEEALTVLSNETIDFALLDVNLGRQTSLPVAERMRELGIPFVLATGYGDVKSILGEYPEAPVVKKPYTGESILQFLLEATEAEADDDTA